MNKDMNIHINIFACLCIAGSILQFVILFFVFLLQSIFSNNNEILEIIIMAIIIFLSITTTLGLVTGIGLFMKKSWSRITGLIISCLSLFSIPIGTAFGVYGLWILFNNRTIELLNKKNNNTYNDLV